MEAKCLRVETGAKWVEGGDDDEMAEGDLEDDEETEGS